MSPSTFAACCFLESVGSSTTREKIAPVIDLHDADLWDFDLPTVTRLQQLKTGALLCASVEMGAILGKLPPEGRAHLRGFARDIGLAFQIADDLLDHEGDEAAAGKALRKDAGAGKQTFVSLLGPERARAQAQALADQAVAIDDCPIPRLNHGAVHLRLPKELREHPGEIPAWVSGVTYL